MSKTKKHAGKTTGEAAAFPINVTGNVAQLVLGNVLHTSCDAHDNGPSIDVGSHQAGSGLEDLDNEADIACADIQAMSRTAGLLLFARTGYEAHDTEHRNAAALILQQLLPSIASRLSRRVAWECQHRGVATIPDAERECHHAPERVQTEQGPT